ncbi:unnamed protein product [Oppiella nova]|uniref:Flap endonuclease 1 n=1 Tax=Oppiella nova TaxID=334625 RepID=A0A7R9LW24_9ACAR|nr:unnamed protein product [Oppiella nova]CAG2167418.1 unnamed protein product [Oppiella nova]
MGILNLSRLIADIAPEAIREVELKSLFGRRIAIDASMCIYQFLIAIRNKDQLMTNEAGETTSHLIGLFYRTIKLLEMGIKPIYVFDGKAPQLKCGELTKRAERRKEAENKLADALEEQDIDNINKFNKRVVRVTRQHNSDCKKLLQLMGLPVIESPSEAEAQCAQLCKEGLVYATATEDMDALTFGSPRLIRNLTSGNNEKVKEYYLDKVLEGLEMTHNQFIDLGILMGCDYCDSIKGIGGKKGLELMKAYGSIEQILEQKYGITEFIDVDIDYGDRVVEVVESEDTVKEEESGEQKNNGDVEDKGEHKENDETKENGNEDELKEELDSTQETDENVDSDKEDSKEDINDSLIEDESINESQNESQSDAKVNGKKKSKDKKGPKIPDNWLFTGARKLFVTPNVLKGTLTEADLKQKDIDEEAIVEFLCVENGFSEDRVRNAVKRIKDSKGKCSQTRIDSFFKMMPNTNPKAKTDNKSKTDNKNKRSGAQSKNASKRGRR